MGKRKASDRDLPETLDLQHADAPSTSGRTGPLAVYFPSGFQPGKHGSCTWELHSNTSRVNDHVVVARTVRKIPPTVILRQCFGLCCNPANSPDICCMALCLIAGREKWILWAAAAQWMQLGRLPASAAQPLLWQCRTLLRLVA